MNDKAYQILQQTSNPLPGDTVAQCGTYSLVEGKTNMGKMTMLDAAEIVMGALHLLPAEKLRILLDAAVAGKVPYMGTVDGKVFPDRGKVDVCGCLIERYFDCDYNVAIYNNVNEEVSGEDLDSAYACLTTREDDICMDKDDIERQAILVYLIRLVQLSRAIETPADN